MEFSTVWRQVATGYGGDGLNRSHRLPSGGGVRGSSPPSGDRWLVRQVATDDRWLRATVAMATNVGYVIISCRHRRGGTRRIRGRRV
jgi:hypothetical protein